MAEVIDGKALAEEIQQEIRTEIRKKGLRPNLAVILVGEDKPSQIYVGLKKDACEKAGIEFHEYLVEADAKTERIVELINFLNKDEGVDAILVQLPLPKHIDTDKVISSLDPDKDVDGFHQVNIDKLLNDQTDFIPGLPLGIIKLIESTKEDIEGRRAVIIAKSKQFYSPLNKLLKDRGVDSEIVNPDDKDLPAKTLKADILVSAAGKAFFIKKDMVKENAIVIDVGTNKIDEKYVVGDVDYSEVFEKAAFITPVPGGVGPMTVSMLLHNTLQLAKKRKMKSL